MLLHALSHTGVLISIFAIRGFEIVENDWTHNYKRIHRPAMVNIFLKYLNCFKFKKQVYTFSLAIRRQLIVMKHPVVTVALIHHEHPAWGLRKVSRTTNIHVVRIHSTNTTNNLFLWIISCLWPDQIFQHTKFSKTNLCIQQLLSCGGNCN